MWLKPCMILEVTPSATSQLIFLTVLLNFVPVYQRFQIRCWFGQTAQCLSQSQWQCWSEMCQTTPPTETLLCCQTNPEPQERTGVNQPQDFSFSEVLYELRLTKNLLRARKPCSHHAAGVGLSHSVGVTKWEAGALCGGGLAKRLEKAAGLLLVLLTKQASCGRTKTASSCREKNTHIVYQALIITSPFQPTCRKN